MPEGQAIVFCEGRFATTYGKTAHGLVRFTRRYRVMSVIDSTLAGRDAGRELDGRSADIPIVADLEEGLAAAKAANAPATHFVIGVAPDGGMLDPSARAAVADALRKGLRVDSGLHELLSEDAELAALAREHGAVIRDIRRCPPRTELHGFSGKIEEVGALKVAVLGTDSAIGKRTTAWILVQALEKAGRKAELIGTGQTAWMQGARYGIVMDSAVKSAAYRARTSGITTTATTVETAVMEMLRARSALA